MSKKTRTLIIVNDAEPGLACSDSVTLSDSVLKRLDGMGSGKERKTGDSDYIKEEEKYWKNRVACLEEDHREIEKTYREALEKAKKDYNTEYANIMDAESCKTLTNKIIECYKNNPKETLKCTKVVEEFTSCVNVAGIEGLKKTEEQKK